ncbi:hypothetical protein K438DRAFT_1802607 [Mycena galopus ATCC 62051]|nr:hypothetical protein K438DRAFT_1802607 [Mycena galopus ATCC 62051]
MATHLRSRLVELDAQIIEQKRVLHQLQQTRLGVEQELHATATFPVLTLPPEITAEIFTSCLAVFDALCFPADEDKTHAPIVLAGVCRAWRDTAFATPVLWSKLKVDLATMTDELALGSDLVEGIIDRLLTRAGNHPLSLEFNLWDWIFPVDRLREIIHRWSHRVEDICLIISGRDTRHLGLDSMAFPLLHSADLQFYDPELDSIPITVFSNAPRLHHLACEIPSNFMLPWSQLTKFEGPICDLRWFTQAPNLTEATCKFEAHGDDFQIITHRSLRSLTIVEGSDDVLPYLILPALHCLDACNHTDSLASFLKRSSLPLISLSVRRTESLFDDLHQCMPLVAGTLESLQFRGDCPDNLPNFLNTSIPDSLPNIRSLTFERSKGSSVHTLVCFLYARSDKLRTVRVLWPHRTGPFLDCMIWAGPPGSNYLDTISDHFSRLGQTGMEIFSEIDDQP